MGVGISTTSDTLTTTCFLLARHPAVQRRLQEELDTASGWSDLMDKPYVTAVLTEALRLWPAVTSVPMRELKEDTTIAGIHIPKGCSILAHSLALQRGAAWGEDADEFRPERFLAGDAQRKKVGPMAPMPLPEGVPETAFTAFGGGMRPCTLSCTHCTSRCSRRFRRCSPFPASSCGRPRMSPPSSCFSAFSTPSSFSSKIISTWQGLDM